MRCVGVLRWKCCRHVVTCRHDMICRSNFGQMGPCHGHSIEDVVAVCDLLDFPNCVLLPPRSFIR
jgi:hypothetical protein